MNKSAEINEFAAALAKAQGAFTAAEREHTARVNSKKGEGSSYSYSYADLAAYLDVCRQPLSENGLSFIQSVRVEGAKATVTTLLLHSSGQWYESDPLTLEAATDGLPAAQAIGSIITYARRYSLSATTGMASEADDDANSGSGNNAETGRKENTFPVCPNCAHGNKAVIESKFDAPGTLFCFGKKGGCGHKWNPADAPPEKPQEEPQPKGTRTAKADAKRKADALAAETGMTTGDKLDLSDAERKYVADTSQEISKEVSREDRATAEANLEAIAAFLKDKSEPVRKALGPLWMSSMKLVNPQWKKKTEGAQAA